MFKKGNPGRPKGSKNSLETASLKTLLQNAFIRNQSAAIAKIDSMFTSADLTDFKWLCGIKASLEPKEPYQPIIIDQSVHEHKTYVKFDAMKEPDLIDFILGRNGHPAKSN